jgi:hypothetical protein
LLSAEGLFVELLDLRSYSMAALLALPDLAALSRADH